MRLILTGGGDSEHFEELDSFFITLLSKRPTLLYIPLAGKKKHYKDGLTRIQSTFSTISFDHIDMCLDLESLTWDYLKDFDAIYIDGGNTFRLMNSIRNSHFYELIKKFIYTGGVINGDSAGAITLGSHLQTAHFGEFGDENISGIKSYQGLNLLGDWAIHCHYDSNEDDEIIEFVAEYGIPVIALKEETGVYIEDRTIKVIGHSELTIFDLGRVTLLKSNQTFTL